MKRLIEFDMEDGETIWIEVDEPELEGTTTQAGRLKKGVEKVKAKISFDQALSKMCSSTEKIVTKLRSLSDQPDEVEMEFGFNFNAHVGIYIASASSESNYKVTLRWQGQESKKENKP